MPTLSAGDDTSLNYEIWGDDQAPAVVLLHAFTMDLRMWAPHIEQMSLDYRVIAMDFRGHGASSAPEDPEACTIELYADDVRALLDILGVDVCALVGCSFGGMVALQFATTWPERVAALVVCDASPAYESDRYDEPFREREREIGGLAETIERFGTEELGKREAAKVTDPFLADAIRSRFAALSASGFLGAFHARRTRPNLIPVLGERLKMPVLLCAGEADPVRVAVEVIFAELPQAQYLMFKGAGHAVPINRAPVWREAVLRFLGEVEDGRAAGGRRIV